MKVVTNKQLLYFCCQNSITVDNFGPNQSTMKNEISGFLVQSACAKNSTCGESKFEGGFEEDLMKKDEGCYKKVFVIFLLSDFNNCR